MYLTCSKCGITSITCINEASRSKEEFNIPGKISPLMIGDTYNCTIKGNNDLSIIFKPGNKLHTHTKCSV